MILVTNKEFDRTGRASSMAYCEGGHMKPCNFHRVDLIEGLWRTLYNHCGKAFVFANLIPAEWTGWRINEV
jgi:hypothetical protein